MHIEQKIWKDNVWKGISTDTWFLKENVSLILVFLGVENVHNTSILAEIREQYPRGDIIFASTAGEILDNAVYDNSVTLTAIAFERASSMTAVGNITHPGETAIIGENLAKSLKKEGLQHILVFADGIHINGTTLIQWIKRGVDKNVTISGGLAADAGKFEQTYIALNSMPDAVSRVILVGLYGDISVWLGSIGWWDAYGEEMIVTKSSANVVYELNHKPILDLYKSYLWDKSADLPSSGLLFPLSIIGTDDNDVVRTLLSIDEVHKSITFAWDIPEGSEVRLMKANFDKIIDAAGDAANDALSVVKNPEFALLISCVWRKLILKDDTAREVQSVQKICGPSCKIAGFYSNGEIGKKSSILLDCALHNQTMTVTLFSEK